jgi:hypothetical protein
MIVTPHSRRLRFVGVLTAIILVATYIHIRPTWRQRSFDYAREFSATVSNYFAGPGGVYNNTLYQEGNKASVVPYHNFSDPCANFPNMDGIQLVMKTGATEAFDKVPTHLLTTLQCVPDFLLFSDMVRGLGRDWKAKPSSACRVTLGGRIWTANKPAGATNREASRI